MAKVKDIKFNIKGQDFCVSVNVGKDGYFSAKIPNFVSEALNIDSRLSFNNLVDLEKEFNTQLLKYKTAATTEELFIGIKYGHSGDYSKKANGDYMHYDKYKVSLSFSNESSSILAFDYDVYIKESVDSNVNWFAAKLGKDFPYWDKEQTSNPDKYYKYGSAIWSSRIKDLKFIPFSETALQSLENAQEKIRSISEFLFNFIEQDEEQILLTLTNQKLLS